MIPMMSTAMGASLAAVFGAVVGSFLNVVAHRLPRGESLAHPPSRCPSCATPVKPYDNVPVLSWLLLRGRCRHCSEPISRRYPLVEAGTALLCALVVAVTGVGWEALLGVAFVLLLIPIALIDLDTFIIPDRLTGPGALIAVALVAWFAPGDLPEHLIAAVAAGGFLLVALLAYPAGMGMGDVKLAAMMGLFLGRAVGPAIFAALIAGSLVGALIIARMGVAKGRKTKIPFGPYLCLGGLVGLFAGDAIVDWYLGSFV
jgi:leader peptidase (prepilin peptidase)/N-methyltransferase